MTAEQWHTAAEEGWFWNGVPERVARHALCAFYRTIWNELPAGHQSVVVRCEDAIACGDVYPPRGTEAGLPRRSWSPMSAVFEGVYLLALRGDIQASALARVGRAFAEHARKRGRLGRVQAAERAAALADVAGRAGVLPRSFSPVWRTSTAVGLALAMHDDRQYGPMPVLADALEEAGCADPDVLAHCRGPGPHVRGCWVVDLVLGKA